MEEVTVADINKLALQAAQHHLKLDGFCVLEGIIRADIVGGPGGPPRRLTSRLG